MLVDCFMTTCISTTNSSAISRPLRAPKAIPASLTRLADIARPLDPAHKEFSCCCCREVSWMTFLGLQFQMDCVGRVMALS